MLSSQMLTFGGTRCHYVAKLLSVTCFYTYIAIDLYADIYKKFFPQFNVFFFFLSSESFDYLCLIYSISKYYAQNIKGNDHVFSDRLYLTWNIVFSFYYYC